MPLRRSWLETEMSDEIKYLDTEEFRDIGYLQEANRLFFHPLGLALELDMDDGTLKVWDYREDDEGIYFAEDVLDPEKAKNIADEQKRRLPLRMRSKGYWTQRL